MHSLGIPVAEADDSAEVLVARVLRDDGSPIREQFWATLRPYLDRFISKMAESLILKDQFDEFAKDHEAKRMVGWLLFCAIQGHLIAMRLFLDGFLVQSGNAERQTLEAIAMAVLCSKPEEGFLERFDKGEYSTSKAIRDLLRRSDSFNVNKNAIKEIREGANFYDNFSHPTKMTIALYSVFTDPGRKYIGGTFDAAKVEQYEKEAKSRVKIADLFPGLLRGIQRNLESSLPPRSTK